MILGVLLIAFGIDATSPGARKTISFQRNLQQTNIHDLRRSSIIAAKYDNADVTFYPAQSIPEKVTPPAPVNSFLRRTSTFAISCLFVTLTWRTFNSYAILEEIASRYRASTNFLISGMLVLNVVALLANVFRPMQLKTSIKVALGVNMIKEALESLFDLYMIIFPNKFGALNRDFYFGKFAYSVFFTAFLWTFSTARWATGSASSPSPPPPPPPQSSFPERRSRRH